MPLAERCEYEIKNEVTRFRQVEISVPEEEEVEESRFIIISRALHDPRGGWLPVTPGMSYAICVWWMRMPLTFLPTQTLKSKSCHTSPVPNVCGKESFHRYCSSELSALKKKKYLCPKAILTVYPLSDIRG